MPLGLGSALASFILGLSSSAPHVPSLWRKVRHDPAPMKLQTSAEQSLLHKPRMHSPQGCVTVTVEGYFLFLFHRSHPLQIF